MKKYKFKEFTETIENPTIEITVLTIVTLTDKDGNSFEVNLDISELQIDIELLIAEKLKVFEVE